jgi:Helix-turn-helix domain
MAWPTCFHITRLVVTASVTTLACQDQHVISGRLVLREYRRNDSRNWFLLSHLRGLDQCASTRLAEPASPNSYSVFQVVTGSSAASGEQEIDVQTRLSPVPQYRPQRFGDQPGVTTRDNRLMAKPPCRRPDHRPVKVHCSYLIEEAADVLHVHKNTVRAWIRTGLPLVDRKRPYLIRGEDLIAYLKRRHAQNKRPCGPGQIYCLRCRTPQTPGGDMADYVARTDRTGDLIGICPRCEMMIYRRISWAHFAEVCGTLEVRITQPHLRLSEGTCLSVSSDFDKE